MSEEVVVLNKRKKKTQKQTEHKDKSDNASSSILSSSLPPLSSPPIKSSTKDIELEFPSPIQLPEEDTTHNDIQQEQHTKAILLANKSSLFPTSSVPLSHAADNNTVGTEEVQFDFIQTEQEAEQQNQAETQSKSRQPRMGFLRDDNEPGVEPPKKSTKSSLVAAISSTHKKEQHNSEEGQQEGYNPKPVQSSVTTSTSVRPSFSDDMDSMIHSMKASRYNQQQDRKQKQQDNFEEGMALAPAASMAQKKTNAFDEFNDVWDDTEQQLMHPEKAVPTRKMLKPSSQQAQVEKPAAVINKPATTVPSAPSPAPSPPAPTGPGMQSELLAKLNLPPTHILEQYNVASNAPGSSSLAPSSSSSAPFSDSSEWDNVSALREEQQEADKRREEELQDRGKQIGIQQANISNATPISFSQALKSLLSQDDISTYRTRIQVFDFRSLPFTKAWKYKIFGPPKLTSLSLVEDLHNVFTLALLPLNVGKYIDHDRILQTIYRTLTGNSLTLPTYGSHWQAIGFQGTDPSTDLRGSGLLGLVQVLWFTKQYASLCLRIFQLSCDEAQNFPFMIVSFNITGMCLQCCRTGKLYGMRTTIGERETERTQTCEYIFIGNYDI